MIYSGPDISPRKTANYGEKMKKIGVTGGIGVGKTTFCSFLNQQGYPCISADEQAKKALSPKSPCYPALLKLFHYPSKWTNHSIAQQIFSNPQLKNQFEAIVHPYILHLIQQQEEQYQKSPLIFYEIPLLFEKKLEKLFHFIVLITCPLDLQKKRIMKRSSLSERDIINRIKNQMPQEEKLPKSDFIVENNKTLNDLKISAQSILQHILSGEKHS